MSVAPVSASDPTPPRAAFPFERHDEDRRLLWIALSLAVAVHVIVLLIRLPEITTPVPPREHDQAIVVKRYVPPPPRIEPVRVARQKNLRRLPIPDPTPRDPEPIREPAPPIPRDPTSDPQVELMLGMPEAPPMGGIALAGAAGVSLPELIRETKIEPEYPETARVQRAEGHVILQAVITKDGTVSELELLRCDQPDLGFEQAAMAAVRQWRYRPATSSGRPVDVYFTVFVSFDLL